MSSFSFSDLEGAISMPRARRYLDSTTDPATGKPDPVAAVALYERNTMLSAEAWGVIADIEVVLRNLIAEAISQLHDTQRPGALRWYDPPCWFASGKWFTSNTMRAINQAKRRIGDSGPNAGPRPNEGRAIAELTLGFWRYLLVSRYEHSLWNPSIRARFPGLSHLSGSDSRRAVYGRVERLNYLRNRIAHHEPIYEPFKIPGNQLVDPNVVVAEAIEVIEWNSPTTAAWIARPR